MWTSYCERQIYTCTLNYFIGKYGEDIGTSKFNNFNQKRNNIIGVSEISQIIFDIIDKKVFNQYTTFYYKKNYEQNVDGYLFRLLYRKFKIND